MIASGYRERFRPRSMLQSRSNAPTDSKSHHPEWTGPSCDAPISSVTPATAGRWSLQPGSRDGGVFAVCYWALRATVFTFGRRMACRTRRPRLRCVSTISQKPSSCSRTRWSWRRCGVESQWNVPGIMAGPAKLRDIQSGIEVTAPAAVLVGIETKISRADRLPVLMEMRKKEDDQGRECEPAGITANCRRSRAGKSDRPRHCHRRHGGRNPEGGTFALRQRDGSSRRNQSEDGRNAALALAAGG